MAARAEARHVRGVSGRGAVGGFTLIELLVVIGVIAVLIAVLLPALAGARATGRVIVCGANQRSMGQAIFAYANDFGGVIPFGPRARPASFTNFYPITGFVTSLLSLEDGAPVGMGLLLEGYLSERPEVMFCPGADNREISTRQLDFVGQGQAQSSYWYRHGSAIVFQRGPDGQERVQAEHVRLSDLGLNGDGDPIRSLVMDTNFIVDPRLLPFGVATITHHRTRVVNVLAADGSSATQTNGDGRYSADVGTNAQFGPRLILDALELGDRRR